MSYFQKSSMQQVSNFNVTIVRTLQWHIHSVLTVEYYQKSEEKTQFLHIQNIVHANLINI